MPLARGQQIDRYEILELLGTGGMGEVYLARDPKLQRLVALKIVRLDRTQGDAAKSLLREARAAAALSHPNVVAIYDVGEASEPGDDLSVPYLAMELVEGRSLRSYVGDGEIPMTGRIHWMRQVATALAAAHGMGLVHRDIKPENIMIKGDGTVKVLDFGIASRPASSLDLWSSTDGHSLPTMRPSDIQSIRCTSEKRTIAGTPFYMAPEQLRGEELDERADQFSWAVVAYELLTGSTPWRRGSDPLAAVSEILSVVPPAPRELERGVPHSSSDVIMRALSKDRTLRFPTMSGLVEQWDGPSSLDRPVPSRAIERKPPRIPKVAVVVAGACIASTLATLALERWPRRPTFPTTDTKTTAPVAGSPTCGSNADCPSTDNGTYHCNSARRVCVRVDSPDCHVYAEPSDAARGDTVWIGGMYPLRENILRPEWLAADLARQDFAQALGSNDLRAGEMHARPIALVICDESADAERAARHLVEDVEVPAVLGFRSLKALRATAPTIFLPNQVLNLITITQADDATRIPEPAGSRLVWRTTLNLSSEFAALAPLVHDIIEPRVRAALHDSRPTRVARLRPRSIVRNETDALFRSLRFNEKSALENGDRFRQFVFDDNATASPDPVVDQILDFAPDVIIYSGPFEKTVLAPLEQLWNKGPRPYYASVSGNTDATLDFISRSPNTWHRFFNLTNQTSTLPNAQLVLHYNQIHPDAPVIRTAAPQPSYDAFYVLAYAVHALGETNITGPQLSDAIGRLVPPGRPVDVGPGGILDAFQTLRSGKNIDLTGSIGSLNFDRESGEAPIDYAILCIGSDSHGRAIEVESGLTYDARTKSLVGSLHCP
ncbi:MAG TPA: bifunctional serine/threonine-protein kinase/ABC transporter substrate-binding protein [Polyangiaceae bacterium]